VNRNLTKYTLYWCQCDTSIGYILANVGNVCLVVGSITWSHRLLIQKALLLPDHPYMGHLICLSVTNVYGSSNLISCYQCYIHMGDLIYFSCYQCYMGLLICLAVANVIWII
jgi:hypothetical protein